MAAATHEKKLPMALRVSRVAELLALPENKVRALIRRGDLGAKRVDNVYLVPLRAVEKFLGL